MSVSLHTVQETRSSELKEAESRNVNAQKKFGVQILKKKCVCRRVIVSWASDLPAVYRDIMTCLSLWTDKEEFDE